MEINEAQLAELLELIDDISPECVVSGRPIAGPSTFPSGLKLFIHPKYHRLVTLWLMKNETMKALRVAIVEKASYISDGLNHLAVASEESIMLLEKELFYQLLIYIGEKKVEVTAKAAQ